MILIWAKCSLTNLNYPPMIESNKLFQAVRRVMQPSKGMESEVWGERKPLERRLFQIGFLGTVDT